MKVMCCMENGYSAIFEVDGMYYDEGYIYINSSETIISSECKDKDYYEFLVRGLATANYISISDKYKFIWV